MSQLIVLNFGKQIKIRGLKEVVAEYRDKNWAGKIFLVSNYGPIIPEQNESYPVFLPKKGRDPNMYVQNGVGVFRVGVIMPEMVGEMKVFENLFILDPEFIKLSNGKIVVMIGDPKGEHRTSLLRIVTNNGNEEMIEGFIRKNLLLEHEEEKDPLIVKRNGIIEAIVSPIEDPNYLKGDFLKSLSTLSEA